MFFLSKIKERLGSLIIYMVIFLVITVYPFNIYSLSQKDLASKICTELNILKGEGNGITDEYLSKNTTRLQAAIITLRLFGKGYEEEALQFKWTDNFSDANEVMWEQGRNIMGYIKQNPEFGWRGIGKDGKFDPFGQVTPQMIYKILLEALGYKQDYGEGGDFKWEDIMDFAFLVGLWDISYKDVLTNADIAVAIVEALQLPMKNSQKTLIEKLVEVGSVDRERAIDLGLLEVENEIISVKEVDLGDIYIGEEPILPASVIVTLRDGSKKEVSVKWEADVDNTKEGTKTIIGDIEGTDIKAFATVNFIFKPLEVLNIEADNLLEVNIKFNKSVDVSNARNKNNYSVTVDDKNVEIQEAIVSKDRKTITLVLVYPIEQQKSIQVLIKKEVGLENNSIKKIDSILDVKLPEVDEINVLGNRKVNIIYSEPIVNADIPENYIFNNSNFQGYITKIDNRTYTLNLTNPLDYGKHVLKISKSIKDYAGYPLSENIINIEIIIDDRPVAVENILSATQTHVIVKFNKPIEPLKKENIISSDGAKVADIIYENDFMTYEIEFERTAAINEKGTVLTFLNVIDFYGNKGLLKINIKPEIDRTKPFFTGYEIKDQDKIILCFSKDVMPTGAMYLLKNNLGKVINVNQAGWYIDEAGNIEKNKVVLKNYNEDVFEPGNYILDIQEVFDYTPQENCIIPIEINIKIEDNIKPGIKEVKMKSNQLFAVFSEKVEHESAIDKMNYSYLNFSDYASIKFPENSIIELLSDQKTVVITLPENFDIKNIDVLQISEVKDLAGNIMTPIGVLAPFAGVDSPPKVISVMVTGKDTITLVLNKNINPSTLNTNDFIVMAEKEIINIKAIKCDETGKNIILTLNEYISSNGQYEGKNITVTTAGGNITTKDFFGQSIQSLTPTKAEDKFPPHPTGMITQIVNNNTDIIIFLNENIRTANGPGKELSENEVSQFIILVDNVVKPVISSKYEASSNINTAKIILTISGNFINKNIRVLFFAKPNNTLTDYAIAPNSLENFELYSGTGTN